MFTVFSKASIIVVCLVHPLLHHTGLCHSGLSATKEPLQVAPVQPQVTPDTGAQQPVNAATMYLLASWQQVAICETGGNWAAVGPVYSGGLGFLNQTWTAYGGDEYAPKAGFASMLEQIAVAERVSPTPPLSPGEGCSGYRGW